MHRTFVLTFGMIAFLTGDVFGQTALSTWVVANTAGNWDDPANWTDPLGTPADSGSGRLVFGAATGNVVMNINVTNFTAANNLFGTGNAIQFSQSNNAFGYTFNGNAINLNGVVGTTNPGGTASATGTHVFNNDIILTGNSTLNANTSHNVTVNGVISGTGFNLAKGGASLLTLSNAANTYSGITTIGAGTVAIAGNQSFGTGSGITFSGNSTIRNDAAITGAGALSKTITLNGGNATFNGTTDFDISGPITTTLLVNRTASFTGTGVKTLTGNITGNSGGATPLNLIALTSAGDGVLNLNGASYAVRGITLQGGDGVNSVLNLGANTAVVIDNNAGGGGLSGFGGPATGTRIVNGAAGSSITMSFEDVGTPTNTTLVVNAKLSGQFKSSGGSLGTTVLNNNDNDFTRFAIQSSTVETAAFGTLADPTSRLGTSSNIEISTRAAATAVATLRYTGAGGTSDKNIFLMNGTSAAATGGVGAILENNLIGGGLLRLTGSISGNGFIDAAGTGIGATVTSVDSQLFRISGTANGELAGVISNGTATAGIALTKEGSGTWNLTGANTYTGATTVSQGTLLVNGSTAAASAVNVAAGATLGGSGTIGGNTTISGIHASGNSPGIQTFGTNLGYTGGAIFNWELTNDTVINAANPNAIFDSIVVGGNLDFAGPTTLNLDFDAVGGVDWNDSFWGASHDTTSGWLLYSVAGTTTNFGNFALATTDWVDGSGNALSVVRSGSGFSLSQQGSNVYIEYKVATVPEPSSMAALCLTGAGTMFLRRRRSAKARAAN